MSPFSINFKDARRARISPGPVSTVKAGPIILGIVELEGSKYLMAYVKAPLPHMASFATPVGTIFNASICLADGLGRFFEIRNNFGSSIIHISNVLKAITTGLQPK